MHAKSAIPSELHWNKWNPSTFQLAIAQDKPVFLYLCMSWGHQTHRFEIDVLNNQKVIDILNEKYIAIKVDCKDNPEIFDRYNQGGWPSICMLTPTGELLHGRANPPSAYTYSALQQVAEYFKKNRKEIEEQIKKVGLPDPILVERCDLPEKVDYSPLEEIEKAVQSLYDFKYKGFGRAPKYPYPDILNFMILAGLDVHLVFETLDAILESSLQDFLGGGFFRFCEDEAWRIPHFEKMLSDNASILSLLLDAYKNSKEPRYFQAAENILRYLETNLGDSATSMFYTAQDSDGKRGERAGFYGWNEQEVQDVLDSDLAEVFFPLYGLSKHSVILDPEGRSVLERRIPYEQLALRLGTDVDDVYSRDHAAISELYRARSNRVEPEVDMRLFTSEQGKVLSPLAEASILMNRPLYLQRAFEIADNVWKIGHYETGGIVHEIEGENSNIYLADQVDFAIGLIHLYRVAGRASDLIRAEQLITETFDLLSDENSSGCLDFISVHEKLAAQRIDFMPFEANSRLLYICVQLFLYTEEKVWDKRARMLAEALKNRVSYYGLASAWYGRALILLRDQVRIDLVTGNGVGELRKKLLFELPGDIPVRSIDPNQKTLWTAKQEYSCDGGQACACITIHHRQYPSMNDPDEIVGTVKKETKAIHN